MNQQEFSCGFFPQNLIDSIFKNEKYRNSCHVNVSIFFPACSYVNTPVWLTEPVKPTPSETYDSIHLYKRQDWMGGGVLSIQMDTGPSLDF